MHDLPSLKNEIVAFIRTIHEVISKPPTLDTPPSSKRYSYSLLFRGQERLKERGTSHHVVHRAGLAKPWGFFPLRRSLASHVSCSAR